MAIVDSLDSITTTNSDEDDGSSDCSSSDIGSSYISDQDEEPISIVTNIRPSPLFHPEDEEEEEAEIEEKSPAGGRIAKDTGCCLYSAITAIFVMVVSFKIFPNGILFLINELIIYTQSGFNRYRVDRYRSRSGTFLPAAFSSQYSRHSASHGTQLPDGQFQ